VGYIALKIAEEIGFSIEDQNSILISGFLLLRRFPPFKDISKIVRYHHFAWNHGNGVEFMGKSVPLASHIIHLADRIDILINADRHILLQSEEIVCRIKKCKDSLFAPQLVEAFESLSKREYFWLDIISIATGFAKILDAFSANKLTKLNKKCNCSMS